MRRLLILVLLADQFVCYLDRTWPQWHSSGCVCQAASWTCPKIAMVCTCCCVAWVPSGKRQPPWPLSAPIHFLGESRLVGNHRVPLAWSDVWPGLGANDCSSRQFGHRWDVGLDNL